MYETHYKNSITVFLFCAFLLCSGLSSFVMSSDTNNELTFEQRVSYQKAIEQVYWQHRIWPKDNKASKPSLRQVMPDSIVRAKVQDYLKKSVALAEYFERPVTSQDLQTEIDRMSKSTKRPGVLQELFLALGNDPHVIAECLARPALVNREIQRLEPAHSHFAQWWTEAKEHLEINSVSKHVTPFTLSASFASTSCTDDTWTPITTINAPGPRSDGAAVWTGSEMIVWGGIGDTGYYTSGGRYDPATDTWMPMTLTNAPDGRREIKGIWTGVEMIVWGGFDGTQLSTGGRYNPVTDTWIATSSIGAPGARYDYSAVWTGSEMIIWGGTLTTGPVSTGGRYDPASDTWAPTSESGLIPRSKHVGVWTGSEMIIWGGESLYIYGTFYSDGARYSPSNDTWLPISNVGAPSSRGGWPAAAWTGSEMIIWGGYGGIHLGDGARYNPATDSWTPMNNTGAPSSRAFCSSLWTGKELIAWAGGNASGFFNTGGRYDPLSDSWKTMGIANAPSPRQVFAEVWTGNEMIVWGGEYAPPLTHYDNGARYCAGVPFDFSGFFPPVDNPPVLNVVKAGSSVAIKFSLNGDQGLDILAPNSPSSRYVDCESTTLDPIDETTTSASGLHYDPDVDLYIYVWKTKSNWASKCREFRLTLSDGTEHLAYFKFK